jgi:crotonobetainyl-CoA:carnitine CoA-transferase CaiB-like acyl-CoA transferase
LPDEPQVIANDYIAPFQHPRFGATKVVGIPVQLSATPGAIRLPAPEFGQHTEQILTGLLGYSWDEVAALKEREVI